ncbi:MAG: glutathione S-transferase N-terminal domain-containing protein [Nitrosospira sp.]
MMKLYSSPISPFSHCCRIMLYEKGMDFQIIDVDPHTSPKGLNIPDPYKSLPMLVQRDLVLYESNIINEYIDDRLPHPRLMPADPEMRARARLFLYGFEQELFCHIDAVERGTQEVAVKARAAIRDNLTVIAPALTKRRYLLGDEYSMLEVAIAPLLWRLEHYEIQLPRQAASVLDFAERLFERPAFIDSLTASEKAMRSERI